MLLAWKRLSLIGWGSRFPLPRVDGATACNLLDGRCGTVGLLRLWEVMRSLVGCGIER